MVEVPRLSFGERNATTHLRSRGDATALRHLEMGDEENVRRKTEMEKLRKSGKSGGKEQKKKILRKKKPHRELERVDREGGCFSLFLRFVPFSQPLSALSRLR